MPGSIRPNKKCMKIAYDLLKIPKNRQQKNQKPSKKHIFEWLKDSMVGQ